MKSSYGCEHCAVRGLYETRTITNADPQTGRYVLGALTSGEQQIVVPGAGKVCAGSSIGEGNVPALDALVHSGDRVSVTMDRAGVARKLGPFAVGGGHVCVLLDPYRTGQVEGLDIPENTLASV